MSDTKKFHKMVLAEHITIQPYGSGPGAVDLHFDFLCPHCARRHVGREILPPVARTHFPFVGYAMRCNQGRMIYLRMPWADQTPRDDKDVYGQMDTSRRASS